MAAFFSFHEEKAKKTVHLKRTISGYSLHLLAL